VKALAACVCNGASACSDACNASLCGGAAPDAACGQCLEQGQAFCPPPPPCTDQACSALQACLAQCSKA
jgi:hypothetical protein